MGIKSRLRKFLNFKGIEDSEFELKCNLPIGYIATGIRGSIHQKKLEGIRRQFPELNIGWLLSGDGEMIRKYTSKSRSTGDNGFMGTPISQSIGDVSGQNAGRDINNTASCCERAWINEIEAQRHLTEKAYSIAETAQAQLSVALSQITDILAKNDEQTKVFIALLQSKNI